MQNRDKIIKQVAFENGLTQKQVREIVSAQLLLVRKMMKTKAHVSVYLRKVGMFVSKPVRLEIKENKIARGLSRNKDKIIKDEDPFKFD